MCRGRAAGIAVGYLADLALADPRRGHPVALFGRGATASSGSPTPTTAGRVHCTPERCSVRWRWLGIAAERAAARRGPAWTAAITAATTFVALGGTSLTRTGAQMADAVVRATMSTPPVDCCRRCADATRPRWMPTGWPARLWSRWPRTPPTRTSRRCCGPRQVACPRCWSIGAPTPLTR